MAASWVVKRQRLGQASGVIHREDSVRKPWMWWQKERNRRYIKVPRLGYRVGLQLRAALTTFPPAQLPSPHLSSFPSPIFGLTMTLCVLVRYPVLADENPSYLTSSAMQKEIPWSPLSLSLYSRVLIETDLFRMTRTHTYI